MSGLTHEKNDILAQFDQEGQETWSPEQEQISKYILDSLYQVDSSLFILKLIKTSCWFWTLHSEL